MASAAMLTSCDAKTRCTRVVDAGTLLRLVTCDSHKEVGYHVREFASRRDVTRQRQSLSE